MWRIVFMDSTWPLQWELAVLAEAIVDEEETIRVWRD